MSFYQRQDWAFCQKFCLSNTPGPAPSSSLSLNKHPEANADIWKHLLCARQCPRGLHTFRCSLLLPTLRLSLSYPFHGCGDWGSESWRTCPESRPHALNPALSCFCTMPALTTRQRSVCRPHSQSTSADFSHSCYVPIPWSCPSDQLSRIPWQGCSSENIHLVFPFTLGHQGLLKMQGL